MTAPGESRRPRGEDRSEDAPDRLGGFVRRIFSHSPSAEERIEQLLEERRRELDEQAARFQSTIADLERREQLLRDSRASVERLLRLGTTDLDAREVEIASLLRELEDRDARMREQEADLARRRSELGAVELKRTALEARERALATREERVAELERQLEERSAATDAGAGDAAPVPSALLAFLPGRTYRLVELEGVSVTAGEAVELEGEEYVVARTGPSPLPGDARRCVYLVRAPVGSSPSGGSS